MPDYEKLYHFLFNAITDVIEKPSDADAMRQTLIEAQQECERKYIEEEYE